MRSFIVPVVGLLATVASASPVETKSIATRTIPTASVITNGPSLDSRDVSSASDPAQLLTYPNGAILACSNSPDVVALNEDFSLAHDIVGTKFAPSSIIVPDCSTLQQGTSITIQFNPTAYANVGYGYSAEAQSSLYTAVSNALTSGCPTPSGGSTVTACSSIPAVTGIQYQYDFTPETGGSLETSIEEMSISTLEGYRALINSIASGVASSANNPDNTHMLNYYRPGDELGYPEDWTGHQNFTNVPATMLAIMTVQDHETDGAVVLQNLGVSFTSVAGQDGISCSDASLVLSGLATVGALAGLWPAAEVENAIGSAALGVAGSLGAGSAGTFLRFGLSMGCSAPSFKK